MSEQATTRCRCPGCQGAPSCRCCTDFASRDAIDAAHAEDDSWVDETVLLVDPVDLERALAEMTARAEQAEGGFSAAVDDVSCLRDIITGLLPDDYRDDEDGPYIYEQWREALTARIIRAEIGWRWSARWRLAAEYERSYRRLAEETLGLHSVVPEDLEGDADVSDRDMSIPPFCRPMSGPRPYCWNRPTCVRWTPDVGIAFLCGTHAGAPVEPDR